jgi:hypothetical protein
MKLYHAKKGHHVKSEDVGWIYDALGWERPK